MVQPAIAWPASSWLLPADHHSPLPRETYAFHTATLPVFPRKDGKSEEPIRISGCPIKGPYFGTLVSIRFQRRMPAFRAMPRANLTDPPNPLISGATGSMPERTFAHLEQSSGLDLQESVAANAATVLDGPYATR